MTSIIFENSDISLDENESVLDGLLRAGHDIPNGCRAGVCQSCIMKSDSTDEIAHAQVGLTQAQKILKHFLSCQCHPKAPVNVQSTSLSSQQTESVVVEKTMLNASVIRLRLKADIDYHPGQYLTLRKDKSVSRCYSIASHPSHQKHLEFHIKHLEEGVFSNWVKKELEIGDKIKIHGPLGRCIYTADKEQALLLAAIGTGLAPILGILRDALENKHNGNIHVIIGSNSPRNFYLIEELEEIAERNQHVFLTFIYQNAPLDNETNSQQDYSFAIQGDIYQHSKDAFPDLKGFRVFLCGAESFTTKMRKQCFLAGAAMGDISADAFVPFNTHTV